MTKSYLTHFSTVFVVHALLLMGTWQLSQTEYFKTQLKSVGNGVMKLQVASNFISTSDYVPQKKTERKLPINPDKPKVSESKNVAPAETTAAQSAGGSAQGSEFGTSANGATDPLSVYKAELRAMIIKHKTYPPMSARLGQTGLVVVHFTVLEDGHIIDVKVVKPSPYERLNESAAEAVKKLERYKPLPKEVADGKLEITVPIKFSII